MGGVDIGYLIKYLILPQSLKIILYHLNWPSISIMAHFLHFNISSFNDADLHTCLATFKNWYDIRRYTQRKRAALQVIQQTLINYRQFLHCTIVTPSLYVSLFVSLFRQKISTWLNWHFALIWEWFWAKIISGDLLKNY